jgi:pyruvate/2-oxoglutarate dehydrogenase complex dihydrolipoamide acyltransferase (E2) component
VTLSGHRRVLNGVGSARFIEDFQRGLEHPMLLLLRIE